MSEIRDENVSLAGTVETLRAEYAECQERHKTAVSLLSKKEDELNAVRNELGLMNDNRDRMDRKSPKMGALKKSRGLITPYSNFDRNWRLFHAMAIRESSGLLYEDDYIAVYLSQFYPFQCDDLKQSSRTGKLEARVELRVLVQGSRMGFDSIHLKCTNHDVSALKVTPLPITSAERSPENEDLPPSIILQTIHLAN